MGAHPSTSRLVHSTCGFKDQLQVKDDPLPGRKPAPSRKPRNFNSGFGIIPHVRVPRRGDTAHFRPPQVCSDQSHEAAPSSLHLASASCCFSPRPSTSSPEMPGSPALPCASDAALASPAGLRSCLHGEASTEVAARCLDHHQSGTSSLSDMSTTTSEVAADISDLPSDVLCRILAHLPRSSWPTLRSVCTQWRTLVDGEEADSALMWQRQEDKAAEPWAVAVEWVPRGYKGDEPRLRVLDPVAGRWYNGGKLPCQHGVTRTSAVAAMGHRVVFLGGTVSRQGERGFTEVLPGAAVWSYHLLTRRMQRLPDMCDGRIFCASASVQGKLIVAGGTGENDMPLKSVEMFDPATDTWTKLPDMLERRGRCFGAEIRGQFWVFTQSGETNAESYAEVYDLVKQKWTSAAALPKNSGPKVRFELLESNFVLTKEVRPCVGLTYLSGLKPKLSLGNQVVWCSSVL